VTEYSRNNNRLIYEYKTGITSSAGSAIAVEKISVGATTVTWFWGLAT
jgi:hypothetical protein